MQYVFNPFTNNLDAIGIGSTPTGPVDTLSAEGGTQYAPVGNNFNFSGTVAGGYGSNGAIVFSASAGEINGQVQVDNSTIFINASNQLTTDGVTGSTTTTGSASSALITFPLGTTAGVYTFDVKVSAFAKTGVGSPAGAGYTIVGSLITDGTTATLIPNQVVDHFEQSALSAPPQPSAVLTASGNDLVVSVTGKSDGAAGFVIDWTGSLTYVFAS